MSDAGEDKIVDTTELMIIELDDEELLDERAESLSTEPISYFGTDFEVLGLVRRLNGGDIVVPSFDPPPDSDIELAGFQRGLVWRKYQMDRFVESLLLGYPVPGIFLVQQTDKKLLVLDGQQRLRTLQRFYSGELESGDPFRLESVGEEYKDLSYHDLPDEARRTLDNSFVHATIIKYDAERKGDEAVYQLFERLNSGGTNLYPHEIRVALYPGPFVDFIRFLNDDKNWRILYGNKSDRLKDQELVLRFVALYVSGDQYRRPLKGFLNSFMKDHRHMEGLDRALLEARFRDACSALANGVGRRAFRTTSQVNAALADAVMVGVATRLDNGEIGSPVSLASAVDSLRADVDFVAAIARATADEERVSTRFRGRADRE